MQLVPHAVCLPVSQAAPAGHAAAKAKFLGKVFPRNTRMQHIQDAAQRCTIIDRAPPATFGRGDKLRDQRLQRQPQLFADFSSRHATYDNPLLAVGPVVLAALKPDRAIGGIGSCFCPDPTARMAEESTMTRDQSMRSAARSLARKTSCSRSQAPAACQSRSRRHQLMPEPQPISWGGIAHGTPDRSKNRMPVSTARLSNGLRPGYRGRRAFGSSGSSWISAPRSSSSIGLAISSWPRKQRKD